MKTILIISPVATHPPYGGNAQRIVAIAEALKTQGWNVYFLFEPFVPSPPPGATLSYWGDHFIDGQTFGVQPRTQPAATPARQAPATQNHPLDTWYPGHLDDVLKALLCKQRFDAVLVEYVVYSKALLQFPPETLRIIDTHDRFTDRYKTFVVNDKAGTPGEYSTSALAWPWGELSISKEDEAKGLQRADVTIAIQNNEARFFESIGVSNVVEIGHLSAPVAPPEPRALQNKLLFVGSIWQPNVDGIRWFIDNVLPGLRQRIPTLVLHVAGGVCDSLAPSESVVLAGRVPDLSLTYRTADIVINPVKHGTGQAVKSVEALSSGRPLVTFPSGARGLENAAGKGISIAQDIPGFVSIIADLLAKPDEWFRQARAASDYITAINRKHLDTLAHLLARKPARVSSTAKDMPANKPSIPKNDQPAARSNDMSKPIVQLPVVPPPIGNDKQFQILLANQYRLAAMQGGPFPSFADVEFSTYSQNGEDGILLYIFSLIGTTSKRAVEACAGDGIECNAANLIINHGWSGLLFDGNANLISNGKAFYAQRTNAWRFHRLPPKLVQSWITAENVNDVIRQNGMSGDIDLLSLDMDGVDFWIWKAIHCINPRVVIVEYNNRWAPQHSVTVPYSSDFIGKGATVEGEGYFGASLSAYVKLGKEKGFRLIGANGPNTNAFFMRNDVGTRFFPEVTVESCLSSDYALFQNRTKYPLIKDKPVVEISSAVPVVSGTTPETTLAKVSLLYVPGFHAESEFRDQHYRMAWYLNPMRSYLDRIYVPVYGAVPDTFGPLPDYLSPELPAMAAQIAEKVVYFDADSPAAWDQAVAAATNVLYWNDAVGTEAFDKRYKPVLSQKRLHRVDHATRRHAAFVYATMSMDFNPHLQTEREDSQRKFAAYAQRIATKNYKKAYALGTGPSLEEALTSKEDFAAGYVVACNSIVKNLPLMERLQPDAFAVSDMVFHSGCSSYAHEFRQCLLKAIDLYKAPVFVPLRDYAIYMHNLPAAYRDFIIGVPYTRCGMPFSPEVVPNFDLRQDFSVLTANNILTMFLLPLATTFTRDVLIMGCDGRKLEDNGYFWTHHKTSQFNEHMNAAQQSYPAFFAIEYNDYYLEHCKNLEHYLKCGEKLGYRFRNLTRSHIPALAARQVEQPKAVMVPPPLAQPQTGHDAPGNKTSQTAACPTERTPSMKTVTILLCTPDLQSDITRRCMDSLLQHTDPKLYKLVLSSNNWDPDFRHAHEMNKCLATLDTEFLVSLDDDVVLTPGWLEALLRVAQSDPTIGAVGCIHTNADGSINHSGGKLYFSEGSFRSKQAVSPLASVEFTPYVCSACVLFRKTALLLDETYAKYRFEVDYCYKLWEAGLRVAVSPHKICHLANQQLLQKVGQNQDKIKAAHKADEVIFSRIWYATGRLNKLNESQGARWTHPDIIAFRKETATSTAAPPPAPAEKNLLHLLVRSRMKLAGMGNKGKIAIYGAGKHTLWLEGLLGTNGNRPSVAALLDDKPDGKQPAFGLTPIKADTFDPKSVDAIVLSSDCFQTPMAKHCKELYGASVTLIDLYEGLPPGPYRK